MTREYTTTEQAVSLVCCFFTELPTRIAQLIALEIASAGCETKFAFNPLLPEKTVELKPDPINDSVYGKAAAREESTCPLEASENHITAPGIKFDLQVKITHG